MLGISLSTVNTQHFTQQETEHHLAVAYGRRKQLILPSHSDYQTLDDTGKVH